MFKGRLKRLKGIVPIHMNPFYLKTRIQFGFFLKKPQLGSSFIFYIKPFNVDAKNMSIIITSTIKELQQEKSCFIFETEYNSRYQLDLL